MNGIIPEVMTGDSLLLGVAFLLGVWTVLTAIGIWGLFRLLEQSRTVDKQQQTSHSRDPTGGTRPAPITDGGLDVHDLRTDGGTGSAIEMVVAYIRPDKLGDVKKGLSEAEAPSLTVTNVSGRGSQPAKKGQWRGEEYTVDLHQKAKIEVVVADVPTEDVVQAIADAARTGEPGDGKVFVMPVTDALQIRTGKRGTEAV